MLKKLQLNRKKEEKDLSIYEAKELESIIIEIINKNRKTCIIGCIYKHSKMSVQEFNNILMPTSEKISKENKDAYLMGDFNINLINYDSHNLTSQFLDGTCSNSFFPYINIPTRHSPRSNALIDNIFHNNINENAISGYLTTDISDHLVQFQITPTLARFKIKPKKILTRNIKSFSHGKCKNDLRQVDWTNTLKLQLSNVNDSFEKFFNQILDKHIRYKYLSRKQQKQLANLRLRKEFLHQSKSKMKFITNSVEPEMKL